ncbi:hypothetical protein AQUCO_00500361v1 [Aquilegia coerulea]|nr:hypothetical protein AQUCO_00500361v1 [Aquilegia coerulea]
MDFVEHLFITIFDILYKNCEKELEIVRKEYPFTPLKYSTKTLRLTFQEGVQMLKDAGVEIDPMEELNTEAKRKLGQLVLEKYDTEFYILHRLPLTDRPFYTMPCEDDLDYSNSFDAFVRGEEIITGGEHINEHELLSDSAEACGVELKTISAYLDSFKYGVRPHGGFGAGLNRVVMLFLGMDNIQETSLVPCDLHGHAL